MVTKHSPTLLWIDTIFVNVIICSLCLSFIYIVNIRFEEWKVIVKGKSPTLTWILHFKETT